MEDRGNPIALASYERLATAECVVVDTVFNTSPLKRVGGIFENTSVRRAGVEECSVEATRWNSVVSTGIGDMHEFGGG